MSDQNEISRGPVRPLLLRHEVPQAEQGQTDREHAVHAHHRGVRMVGRQAGADLEVAHDGQVDEKAEHPSPEEVPEADGDQEHHRPVVREPLREALHLAGPEAHEAPGLDGEQRQRDDLGGAEQRPERHRRGRRAREVQVMHRADHATQRVDDDVEVDHSHGVLLGDHAEQHEDVGDHHVVNSSRKSSTQRWTIQKRQ